MQLINLQNDTSLNLFYVLLINIFQLFVKRNYFKKHNRRYRPFLCTNRVQELNMPTLCQEVGAKQLVWAASLVSPLRSLWFNTSCLRNTYTDMGPKLQLALINLIINGCGQTMDRYDCLFTFHNVQALATRNARPIYVTYGVWGRD